MGYAEPVVRLAVDARRTLPDPIDSVMFLNSGSEAIDGALKLARRVTGRPGIVAFRGGFHGRTFGATSVTTSNLNYRTGYEPLLPGVYFAPVPGRLPGVRRRRGARVGGLPRDPRVPVRDGHRAVAGRVDPHRAGPGRGRLQPGAAPSFLRGLRADLRRARDPAHRRRGPDRASPGPAGCGASSTPASSRTSSCMAKAIANGLPLVGDRHVAGADGALGQERPRLDVRRQPGRLRRGHRGPRDDRAARASSRMRPPAGRSSRAGLDRIAAEEPRIGDVRGPGLMIGVEFVTDRDDARARRRAGEGADRPGGRPRPARPDLRLERTRSIRWIPPIDVTRGRDQRGASRSSARRSGRSERAAGVMAAPDRARAGHASRRPPVVTDASCRMRRTDRATARSGPDQRFWARNFITSSRRKRRSPRLQTR